MAAWRYSDGGKSTGSLHGCVGIAVIVAVTNTYLIEISLQS